VGTHQYGESQPLACTARVYNGAMGEADSREPTMIVDFWKGSRTVCVTLHGTQTPSDAEWDTVLEGMRRFGKENGNDFGRLCCLALTDSAGPNAKQRAAVAAILRGQSSRVAVVSGGGPLVHAVVTALSWFNPDTKMFAPNKAEAIREHLRLSRDDLESVAGRAVALQARFRKVQVVGAFAAACGVVPAPPAA
jgi:hypothetical protein